MSCKVIADSIPGQGTFKDNDASLRENHHSIRIENISNQRLTINTGVLSYIAPKDLDI